MLINLKKKKGIAVAATIGIIAVLVIISIGIIISFKYELVGVISSSDLQKASKLADAGIQRAIGEIKKDVKSEFIDDNGDDWYSPNSNTKDENPGNGIAFWDNTLLGGLGRYNVCVIDCQRQVNINNASADLLVELPGIDAALAAAIIAARPFQTKKEIMKVAGIGEGTYNNLKNYITIISWIDPSCNNRSPININTADEVIVKAVLKGTGLSDASVNTAYTALNSAITGLDPFYLWTDFDNVIDSTSLSSTDKDIIKNNANPNRLKPANNTTEFCFFSGGYYEITSTGKIYETSNQNNIAAQRTINTVVQIFKTIYYTTKEDFRGEDANYNLTLDIDEDTNGNGVLDVPTVHMVNWMDSCPINSTQDNGSSYASGYDTLSDALKLGYWDNFDEDNDNENKEGWIWKNWTNIEEAKYPMIISDDNSDGDNELYGAINTTEGNCWAKFKLEDTQGWLINDEFSFRGHAENTFRIGGTGYEDGCAIEFQRGTLMRAKLCLHRFGYCYPNPKDITVSGSTVALDPVSYEIFGKDYLDSMVYLALNDGKNQIRVYNTGQVLYGITPCATAHYTNWHDDEFHDEYHGTMPEEATYKLVVSSDFTPNYRVYIAPTDTFHNYYDYDDGSFFSSMPQAAVSQDYILIPIHQSSNMYFDRYGLLARGNTGSNEWNTTNSYLLLQHHQHQYLWDEIRLIVPSGYYESYWYEPDEGVVDWGCVLWNKTIPISANSLNETVSTEINAGSGYSLIINGGSVNSTSDRCRFKITLASEDDNYSETPILEDIIITYIISPNTIYYAYMDN